MLKSTGAGFGALALRELLAGEEGTLLSPHHAPRADAVIFLFMYGGPSQVDTFDPKPELAKWTDRPIPAYRPGDGFFNKETKPTAFPSPYSFKQHGESGLWISEKYPHLAEHADDLCVIRSLHADSNNHGPALSQMNSGFILQGYPSMGSWLSYGLGSPTRNLPTYVVLLDDRGAPVNGNLNWSNGFMPAAYQGVPFRSSGTPIVNLANAKGVGEAQQRARLELIGEFNREYADTHPGSDELEARIASYELAARMQAHAPEVTDLFSEPGHVRKAYGLEHDTTANFGRNCLLARRLVERGVRFVQVYSGGNRGAGRGVGCPQGSREESRSPVRADRPADRGPAAGPEAARHARAHAGGVGRGVRAPAHAPEERGARSQSLRIHDVARGRRFEGGHGLWSDG